MTGLGTEREATRWNLLQLTAALYQPPGEASREDLEAGRLHCLAAEVAHTLHLRVPLFVPPAFEIQGRFVTLFVTNPAGVPAPPYVGYARDDTLFGESTQALRVFLVQQGFSLNESWNDLADHIALLAEAGCLLMDKGGSGEALELTERFLLPWFARYADVLGAAEPDPYGPLSRFLYQAFKEVACEVAA